MTKGGKINVTQLNGKIRQDTQSEDRTRGQD